MTNEFIRRMISAKGPLAGRGISLDCRADPVLEKKTRFRFGRRGMREETAELTKEVKRKEAEFAESLDCELLKGAGSTDVCGLQSGFHLISSNFRL